MSDKRGPTITWDAEKRDRLRDAIGEQVAKGTDRLDVFEFDGHKFLLGYAQYLLFHLDQKLEPTPVPVAETRTKPKRKPTPKSKPEPRRTYARSKGGR